MTLGEIIVIYMPPDAEIDYDCYLSGPVVEVRADGLLVVEPTQYKPMPEDWRPYDGVRRVLVDDLGEQRNAPRFRWAGNGSEGGELMPLPLFYFLTIFLPGVTGGCWLLLSIWFGEFRPWRWPKGAN